MSYQESAQLWTPVLPSNMTYVHPLGGGIES